MAKTAQNLIAGRWVGDPQVERFNPADANELVVVSVDSGPDQVDAAVAAAAEAQQAWAANPAPLRGRILTDASTLLSDRSAAIAEDLVREEGKTLAEAQGEVARAVGVLGFFGGEGYRLAGDVIPASSPETHMYVTRHPIGVAAVITPWNFPIAIPAWKAAPALVSGNTVVLKPAELTPLSANHLAQALLDAGLPEGVLNVVHGNGHVAGEALIADSRVGAVSFTGSTTVGNRIHDVVSARKGRIQLEMGGKNAILVTRNAKLDDAAAIVARSAFGLSGQACTAASRVVVDSSVADALVEAIDGEIAAGFRPGPGLDGGQIGPIVSADQADSVWGHLNRAIARGNQVAIGSGEPDGLFVDPTLVRGVNAADPIAQEEIFGPVLALIEVEGFEAGVEVVNGVQYGLTAGICTQDLSEAHRFADLAEAGVVKINQPTVGLELQMPFGGIKDSSTATFREQGTVATDFWTWSKSVYISYQ